MATSWADSSPFFSDTCKWRFLMRPHGGWRMRKHGWCLRQTEGEECTFLTSLRRALAFSPGSIRRPAVAFRTTGVRLHASLGIAFLAIFNSCRMMLPPCNEGRRDVSSSHLNLIFDMHVGQVSTMYGSEEERQHQQERFL